MKTFTFLLLVFFISGAGIRTYSQENITTQNIFSDELEIARSCYHNLRGARNYSMAVNCLELTGGTLTLISLANELSGAAFVGVPLGVGGIEMSKTEPIPFTKARRDLDLLKIYWTDTVQYNRIYHQMKIAESLSYTTMALTFGSQLLIVLGLAVNSHTLSPALYFTGFACAGVSLVASIGASVMAKNIIIELKKQYGSVGLGIGSHGAGLIYNIP